MFSIEWLKGAALISTEETWLGDVRDAIKLAQRRAASVQDCPQAQRPDCFRITAEDRGLAAIVYPI
ncbi:MAG TPA: hypothetical protein VMB71_01605 [Acetobacteraceae bacterium]|nr:hypothetical protein [Acetobacteraceae bacterium]